MSSLAATGEKNMGTCITPGDAAAKTVRNSQKTSETYQKRQKCVIVDRMKF